MLRRLGFGRDKQGASEVEGEMVEEIGQDEVKLVRLKGVVSTLPVVIRTSEGEVVSASMRVKVQFKGELNVMLRGDTAKAYWSITPGMSVSFLGREMADKEYLAESIEVIAAV